MYDAFDKKYGLVNLDAKLYYLQPSERAQLQQLILDYKHFFSNIPTLTDKICHDVNVCYSTPAKQHPYRLILRNNNV